MNEVKEILFAACSTFILIEIIYFLTPRETAVKCLYGLIYTVIIAGCVLSAVNADYGDFSVEAKFETEAVKSMYLTETEKALCEKIGEALEAAGVQKDSITAVVDIDDGNEIQVKSILIKIKYFTDMERAKAVISGLFWDLPQVEVVCSEQ